MKIKVQAQHLKPGDVVGSGEIVVSTFIGCATQSGKVNVRLRRIKKDGRVIDRVGSWGKYTIVGVERDD